MNTKKWIARIIPPILAGVVLDLFFYLWNIFNIYCNHGEKQPFDDLGFVILLFFLVPLIVLINFPLQYFLVENRFVKNIEKVKASYILLTILMMSVLSSIVWAIIFFSPLSPVKDFWLQSLQGFTIFIVYYSVSITAFYYIYIRHLKCINFTDELNEQQ